MKRIEAFIQSEKLSPVVDSIQQVGVGGLSVVEVKGQGAGKRQLVQTGRGTSTQVAEYDSIASVITVVDDAKVDLVKSAIANAAGTNSKGDGKIFVSPIEDITDIGSRRKESFAS